ncbi:MAG: glycine/sarcosine/betaine reductase component B subunit [Desulfovibrio sp.]|uniref:glycine/sarcosine/betaine reductase component B subunit n=1 Tax=Desulfovibrio sp. 7SRBS1 TaxID=3378064 RepID=UPI003B3CF00A
MGMGPSSKETTLHHFRDPLVETFCADEEIDFLGVVLQGTPEVFGKKRFVARRSGVLMETMRVDGVIVSIDSWGNSHIDFTSVLEALGERRIPAVGLSFVGNQASFVVTNEYMDSIIDYNKNSLGIETTVMAENTAVPLDAIKAMAILKNKMRKRGVFEGTGLREVKKLRRLITRTFATREVRTGTAPGYSEGVVTVGSDVSSILARHPDLEAITLQVVQPGHHDFFVNSILDFAPIAVKVCGEPGEGVTHVLSGVQVLLTGAEAGGIQPSNLGCAVGVLSDKVKLGMRGTPSETDRILHVDVTFKDGAGRTREGIMAAHVACDELVQAVRNDLRSMESSHAAQSRTSWDIVRRGLPRVALVKLVSGLGCMYDTGIFPTQPAGYAGCRSIMDLANMQVALTSNEYRDGVVCSLS